MDGENTSGQTMTGPTPRELTFGEKAVGLTFNPSGDKRVNKIKKLYAEIIDDCRDGIGDRVFSEFECKLQDEAIMKAVAGQMASVKLITWKD